MTVAVWFGIEALLLSLRITVWLIKTAFQLIRFIVMLPFKIHRHYHPLPESDSEVIARIERIDQLASEINFLSQQKATK